MSAIAQDVIVTLVALGAAFFVVRQVISAFRPDEAGPACDHCEPGPPTRRDAPR